MRVLVVGSGGREHALVWKIAQSPRVEKVFAAPGNGGMAKNSECVNIGGSDIKGLIRFAKENKIDLTVVGPEAPLVDGIVDRFNEDGLKIVGPTKKAALLEGSKVFAKTFMKRHDIPTADFEIFTDSGQAISYLKEQNVPKVVKADGLAAGKGVIVAESLEESIGAVKLMLDEDGFGEAGKTVVIEEPLFGEEASFIALTDGKDVLPLASSQDHKRIYDNDKGPNTGGMGAYSPTPVLDDELAQKVTDQVMNPCVRGMAEEGEPFKGILYAGIMINKRQIKVLEFNVRMGDPETQPILVRLKSDLVELLEATTNETLSRFKPDWDRRPSVCVVMASSGYPGKYEKGKPITGIDAAEALGDVVVFHAGTKLQDGQILTNGGRVLGVTAQGDDLKKAIEQAYRATNLIRWEGSYFRTDIGRKAYAA